MVCAALVMPALAFAGASDAADAAQRMDLPALRAMVSKRVNVNEDCELRDAAKKFRVTPEQLKEAVAAVELLGPSSSVSM